MNRRSFLSCLAAFPLIVAFARQVKSKSAENMTIRSIYAIKGEKISCENGHPICEFMETVNVGDIAGCPEAIGKLASSRATNWNLSCLRPMWSALHRWFVLPHQRALA